MRIVMIGQAAFAEKALAELHARGEEIVQVFAPPDAPGGRADPLAAAARKLGLPLSLPVSFRGEAEYQQIAALKADLIVMAFVTLIVPERILYAPRFQSICFHPSLLPRHRGASAINWAIIEGDRETGVTWFWPDRGVDTGPILLQRRVAIPPAATTGSLYFDQLFPLGIESMLEALELIKAGTAPRLPQDERQASYEPPCRDEHAALDFREPAEIVYNRIRGCDPQPGAFARLGERRLRLYDTAFDTQTADAAAGTILAVTGDGMRLALDGATLLVRRARFDPAPRKVAPLELAEQGLLEPGARLI